MYDMLDAVGLVCRFLLSSNGNLSNKLSKMMNNDFHYILVYERLSNTL